MNVSTCSQQWSHYFPEPEVICRFSIDLNSKEGTLTFNAEVNRSPFIAPCDCLEEGSFVEGLWEGDCAELFLCNPSTGYYIELNLSSRGSWWYCPFSAPHIRVKGIKENEIPLNGVISSFVNHIDSWSASLVLPLSSLPLELQLSPDLTTGNVCFCLHDKLTSHPQVNNTVPSSCSELFFSHCTLADDTDSTPNFHVPQKWRNNILSMSHNN
jgi:hypothetical protein